MILLLELDVGYKVCLLCKKDPSSCTFMNLVLFCKCILIKRGERSIHVS